MIRMWCDHCGAEIARDVNGGVRYRVSNAELRLHLCETHQDQLWDMIQTFAKGQAKEVSPSLRKP